MLLLPLPHRAGRFHVVVNVMTVTPTSRPYVSLHLTSHPHSLWSHRSSGLAFLIVLVLSYDTDLVIICLPIHDICSFIPMQLDRCLPTNHDPG